MAEVHFKTDAKMSIPDAALEIAKRMLDSKQQNKN